MPWGPGKYDAACTAFRNTTQADGVMVVVFGGSEGDGFSCQLPADLLTSAPTILRSVADEIERAMAEEQKHDRN